MKVIVSAPNPLQGSEAVVRELLEATKENNIIPCNDFFLH